MGKIFLLSTFLILFFQKTIAQYDFRDSKWGMSIDEVKKSEYPTAPTKEQKSLQGASGDGSVYYGGTDLYYEDITINDLPAKLIYHFENNQLSEVRLFFKYGIYQKGKYSLTDRSRFIKAIHKTLVERDFSCLGGSAWIAEPMFGEAFKCLQEADCAFGEESLAIVENCISLHKIKKIQSKFFSDRTFINILYNLDSSDWLYKEYIAVITFSPTAAAEKEYKKKSGF